MGGNFNRGGGSSYSRRFQPMADINVTPFVDVMLVLLIVFMVTAPLLSVGVPVNLPKTHAAPVNTPDEPLVVSIDSKGQVFIQETGVLIENLAARLAAVTGANPDTRIFVRGDKKIDYGKVMQVMGQISAAGYSRVSLLAELPDRPKRK